MMTTTIPAMALAMIALCAVLALVTLAGQRRAEQRAPRIGHMCDVPGGHLHYTDHGRGHTVLLIHGLGGNLRNFSPELVARLAQSCRVIAVDRPGSGYSTATGPVPDLHGQAAMMASLIEHLDCAPVTLAGHSLGGALSLALVAARPDLVASLTLIAPVTQVIATVPGQFRVLLIAHPVLRRLMAWLVIGPAALLAGRARSMPAFDPDPVPADFAGTGGGALLFRPDNFDAASRDAQAVTRVLPGLIAGYAAIACPVDVLFGEQDRILAPALHGTTFVTQVRDGRCTLIAGGHMLPYVHPVATADWIAQTVAQRSQTARA